MIVSDQVNRVRTTGLEHQGQIRYAGKGLKLVASPWALNASLPAQTLKILISTRSSLISYIISIPIII